MKEQTNKLKSMENNKSLKSMSMETSNSFEPMSSILSPIECCSICNELLTVESDRDSETTLCLVCDVFEKCGYTISKSVIGLIHCGEDVVVSVSLKGVVGQFCFIGNVYRGYHFEQGYVYKESNKPISESRINSLIAFIRRGEDYYGTANDDSFDESIF